MKCSNCGNELTPEMFSSGMCFSCGQSTSDSEKAFKEEQDKLKEEQKKELERQKKKICKNSMPKQLKIICSLQDMILKAIPYQNTMA